jgi:hypothetical protein
MNQLKNFQTAIPSFESTGNGGCDANRLMQVCGTTDEIGGLNKKH